MLFIQLNTNYSTTGDTFKSFNLSTLIVQMLFFYGVFIPESGDVALFFIDYSFISNQDFAVTTNYHLVVNINEMTHV